MKVLLYAVFKDHEVMTLVGSPVRIPWHDAGGIETEA